MAMQHVPSALGIEGQRSHLRPVLNLSELSGYSTFGDLLATVRKNTGVTQQAVVEATPHYFPKHVPVINARIYGDLERDRRAPSFDELEPLYQTLTEGCGIGFSPVERELYVLLARKRIQRKKKRIETVVESQWQELAEKLAKLDDTKRSSVQILDREASQAMRHGSTPPAASRRQEAITRALRTDMTHLVERDDWSEHMISYLTTTPPKKLVAIQAVSGTGKTSALTLLTKRLANIQNYYLIPYRFSSGEDKTAGDHLDTFLATLLTDLELPQSDETKVRPLDDRIEQVLAELIAKSERGIRVVLLLDEAQEILEPTGELSARWQQFLHTFIRYSHTATIYLASREWPGWPERERTYVKETELPSLSPEAGVTIWKRFGFEDVPDDLLHQASLRCGGNPQMIELRAAHLQRPGFTYVWQRGRGGEIAARQAGKNENTLRLEKLLAEESIFDLKTDVQSREVLQQVVSKRLSHQALQLLEILSVSPLAVPFPLLDEVCLQAELAFDELVHCSLIDQDMISSQRATVVPLAREARLHALLRDQRKGMIEREVLHLYEEWLYGLQEFRNDSEKSALATELLVLLMKQEQLLKAAEMLINFGWLCALFGHLTRLERVYEEVTRGSNWKANPEGQAGRSLLRYQFALLVGQKVDPWERDRAYRKVREDVLAGQVTLQSHTEIYLMHYLMLPLLRAARFSEAYRFLDETVERISKAARLSTEEQASFLQSKSYLLGRWSEDKATKQNAEEIGRLRRESVEVLSQCVALWKQGRRDALPLQEKYINFKLARGLNDCAYYLRLLHRLEEAENAIKECLVLKEGGATLPRSLAVSLGEYSQILASLGRFREALYYSDRALQLIDTLIREGDTSASSDKGMLLVERAHVYLQQARLGEAKRLFEEAMPLLTSETRQEFRDDADRQLQLLRTQLEIPVRPPLDAHWYERYLPLASYDDLQWLSQAGPFSEEEQKMWDKLIHHRHEPIAWQQLSDIIVESRRREFSTSRTERRVPRITYPAIDIDDVKSRIADFRTLRTQIEAQEKNAVVRRLYSDKIEEHLQILQLVEATYHQDTQGVRKYNELLYGKPTTTEMVIALREFFTMLSRAQDHPEAGILCQQLLKQLKQWHICLGDFVPREERKSSDQSRLARRELQQKSFSAATVQRFFEDVMFSDYHFSEWRVVPASERDNMALDLDLCVLYLPTHTRFSAMKVCELLAEEIETHMFRSVAGKKSPLALLSSGTKGYLPADEGLAIYYVQQMMQAQGFGKKSYSWITTLTPGMASGVIFPAMNFSTMYDFLRKAFLISNLLAGRFETLSQAEEAAQQDALIRTARTFRGVPDLHVAGVCNLKDRVYLQGYLEVSKALEVVEPERFLVGSVGVSQLEDMAELNILQPAIPHRRLALDPDLLDRVAALDER